uniref:Alkene monooxygenase alpha-subunit n=1 Tax=Alteromonadaceae bacterium PE-TB08W TaxID=1199097 RepID=A0A3G9E9D5_9ALTE|nr:alkene monooxygenase alpha-subunit [Alteromonadaceae bacterium PE-TB08W]
MTANLTEVHEKAKSYDWEYSFVDKTPKFRTKYNIPNKGKDPFRMLVRDYMKMEAEKDDRTHGFLDGALRMGIADKMEPRFNECLKLTLPDLNNAEYQAIAACGMIISAMPNQELRHGYQAQMMDEARHAQLEMTLRNFYLKNVPDPAGWDIGQKGLYQHPGGLVSVGEFQHFNTGDPIDCIVDLNIIIETAFTNILLVATPQAAVMNGDHAMATTLLSIQSDEARHMANGYGTMMSILRNEENVPLINDALERHFWHAHKGLDALVSWQSEYGSVNRPWAYKDVWQEWIVDDFVGGYLDRLSEFGVEVPKLLGKAVEELEYMPHTTGQVFSAIWPLNFWRSDAMGPRDYEWFEEHYPGWYDRYGAYWDGYKELADPANGRLIMQELESLPPICQVCQLPCAYPALDINEFRLIDIKGKQYPTCSEGCEHILKKYPDAYTHRKQFWAKYHDWDLADVILDLGYIRPDGKTLIGQPTVAEDQKMWTIDDIRRLQVGIKDPLHGVCC